MCLDQLVNRQSLPSTQTLLSNTLISTTFYKTTSDLTFGKLLWTQQLHNTLCSPRPLFFLFLPLRKSERFKATCDEENVFLKLRLPHSSIQAFPTSIPAVPCRGTRSSRSTKPRELGWSASKRGRLGISHKRSTPGSRYRVHNCTPANLSKAQTTSTTSSEHGAGWVHPLSISPSEPTGWHHQLLVVQNHRQLRKTDVVPPRHILTLKSLCHRPGGVGRGKTKKGEGSRGTSK